MLDGGDIRLLKEILSSYNYIMTTAQLGAERPFYKNIQRTLEAGVVEKVKWGHYHWVGGYGDSEVTLINYLFPDTVLCIETALFHYGYNGRNPAEWNITIDKNVSRNHTNIDYPFVKACRVEPSLVTPGETKGRTDFVDVRVYDRDRTICNVLQNMNKMDREIFNKAIQGHVKDPRKNVPNLMEYTKVLHVQRKVKELIGVRLWWLILQHLFL